MTRTRATPAPFLVAWAVTGMLLTGCSASSGGMRIVEGGPVAYVERESEGGRDALIEGTIDVSESCITIRGGVVDPQAADYVPDGCDYDGAWLVSP